MESGNIDLIIGLAPDGGSGNIHAPAALSPKGPHHPLNSMPDGTRAVMDGMGNR
jgi:hypothetical protein